MPLKSQRYGRGPRPEILLKPIICSVVTINKSNIAPNWSKKNNNNNKKNTGYLAMADSFLVIFHVYYEKKNNVMSEWGPEPDQS